MGSSRNFLCLFRQLLQQFVEMAAVSSMCHKTYMTAVPAIFLELFAKSSTVLKLLILLMFICASLVVRLIVVTACKNPVSLCSSV